MTRPRLTGLMLAIAVTVAAACSGGNSASTADPPTTPTTTESADTTTTSSLMSPPSTTGASTTTSPSTTTTTTPETTPATTAPPSTADAPTDPPDDEDWVAVVQHLVDLRDELYATSDPSRVGEVCSDAAFCYAQMIAQLTDAQSNGWRVVDQGSLTILSAHVESITDADFEIAVIRTEIRLSEQHGRVVDADGNTVYELVPDDPNAPLEGVERWTLIRTPDGWRLLDQETIS